METQNQHLAKASHHVSSSLGRGAVARPSQSQTVIQAQLETTTPGDAYEQEAENTANLVMRQLSQGGDSVNPSSLHRSVPTISCSGGNPVGLSSQMESQLNTMQGGGHAMPSGLRSQMEGSFGCDFSNVRLHTDTNAAVMRVAFKPMPLLMVMTSILIKDNINPILQKANILLRMS